MAAESTVVRRRKWSFAMSESLRIAALRYHSSIIYRPRYAGPTPDRLLIAPTDLRTSDATLAHDIYSGRFVFAGAAVDASGIPVFAIEPPSEAWAREQYNMPSHATPGVSEPSNAAASCSKLSGKSEMTLADCSDSMTSFPRL